MRDKSGTKQNQKKQSIMKNQRKSLSILLIASIIFALIPMIIIYLFENLNRNSLQEYDLEFAIESTQIEKEFINKLQGKMEFYWNQFIEPLDSVGSTEPNDFSRIDFPGNWNKKKIGELKIPGKGFASYRTILHFDTIHPMALSIFEYCNSYALWLNGELISKGGQIGKSFEETIPHKINQIATFTPKKGPNELIIHTSNFIEKFGGFRQAILIGPVNKIEINYLNRQVIDAFVLGIIFLSILFFITLYLFNLHKKSFLLFAALVFFIFFRQLLLSNLSFIDSWINQNISFYLKTTTFAAWISSFLLLCLYHDNYPNKISNILIKVFSIWIIAFSIFILVASYYWVSVVTHMFQFIIFFILGYIAIMSVRTLILNKDQNQNIALGILWFILFSMIEALIYNRIIHSVYTLHYGLIYFVLFESFALGSEFSKNYRQRIQLTEELKEQNKNLKDIVAEKTREVIDASEREMLATMILKTKSDKLLHHLHKKISRLKADHQTDEKDLNEIIYSLNQELNQNKKEKLLFHFTNVHPVFYEKLLKLYPSLSQNEIKLCAYIKLNLNNKEIAEYLHVQPESVRKSKLRLRAKMGNISGNELLAILKSLETIEKN